MAKVNQPYNNRIMFIGECIDNQDPMGLGRIRAVLKTENNTDRDKSVNDAKGVTDKWGSQDPFVYRPLLPLFVNTSPKPTEPIHIMYSNPDDKSNKDQFYVGGIFTSLTKISNQPYNDAIGISNQGTRNKSEKPLRTEGVENEPYTKGIYAEPDDITIDGRGSADLVLKHDTALLRAGKYTNDPQPNQYPVANDNRSFLQLSKFNTKTTYGQPEKFYTFNFKDKPIKLLVEYNIINSDNTKNKYTGSIYLYMLNPFNNTSSSAKISTANFGLNTVLSNISEKSLIKEFTFKAIKLNEITKIVNDVIQGVAKGEIPDLKLTNPRGPYKINISGVNRFPFYFRPQPELYEKLSGPDSGTTVADRLFVSNLMSGINAISSDATPGYGLVYDDSLRGDVPFLPNLNKTINITNKTVNNTASLLGGDYVYLLSHRSTKKSTGKINLSQDTLLGVTEKFISDEIEPKTSSTVRGEELIELLNLIVQFLIGHVHPYHGMKPDGKSVNGITPDQLLQELENAREKILNKYIRIN